MRYQSPENLSKMLHAHGDILVGLTRFVAYQSVYQNYVDLKAHRILSKARRGQKGTEVQGYRCMAQGHQQEHLTLIVRLFLPLTLWVSLTNGKSDG